jgi:hypothetical protein
MASRTIDSKFNNLCVFATVNECHAKDRRHKENTIHDEELIAAAKADEPTFAHFFEVYKAKVAKAVARKKREAARKQRGEESGDESSGGEDEAGLLAADLRMTEKLTTAPKPATKSAPKPAQVATHTTYRPVDVPFPPPPTDEKLKFVSYVIKEIRDQDGKLMEGGSKLYVLSEVASS